MRPNAEFTGIGRNGVPIDHFSQAQADAFGHAAAEVEDGIECVGCTD